MSTLLTRRQEQKVFTQREIVTLSNNSTGSVLLKMTGRSKNAQKPFAATIAFLCPHTHSENSLTVSRWLHSFLLRKWLNLFTVLMLILHCFREIRLKYFRSFNIMCMQYWVCIRKHKNKWDHMPHYIIIYNSSMSYCNSMNKMS